MCLYVCVEVLPWQISPKLRVREEGKKGTDKGERFLKRIKKYIYPQIISEYGFELTVTTAKCK